MTHIFECPTNEFILLNSGEKKFDILKFTRPVSIGDTIIYQRLADTENEETEDGQMNETPFTEDEYCVSVGFIFPDLEGALKKGFTAISF